MKFDPINPRKAKPMVHATDAWFYANKNSIEVCIERPANAHPTSRVSTCKINRLVLKKWIEATEPK